MSVPKVRVVNRNYEYKRARVCVWSKCVPKVRVVYKNHEFESTCVCVSCKCVPKVRAVHRNHEFEQMCVLDQIRVGRASVYRRKYINSSTVTSFSLRKRWVPSLNCTVNLPFADMPTTTPACPPL